MPAVQVVVIEAIPSDSHRQSQLPDRQLDDWH
jgi:hypothetical protein